MGLFYSTVSDGMALDLWDKLRDAGADLGEISPTQMAGWIETYLTSIAPQEMKLSEVQPDFEQIAFQFRQQLANKNTWNDAITAATGQTLVEMVSSGISYDQLSIERAAQETMSDTARLPVSQYTIARMLGVHIRRKVPAKVVVTLRNTDYATIYTVPPYTQFEVNNIRFFNRDPIVFNVGQNEVSNVALYQGTVEKIDAVSTGTAFQRYVLGNGAFTISDYDLVCHSTEGEYVAVRNGLWHYGASEKVFFERTTPDGKVEIQFGNNIYGKIPELNSTLHFTYVITNGSEGNNSVVTQRVTVEDFPTITGTTVSATVGGDDEHDPDLYRLMAPHMYNAKDRAVTRDDHEAIAFDYPGVVDVIFQGQAEINPNDVRYMNLVSITAVTAQPWSEADWQTFFDYLNTKSIYRLEFFHETPGVISTPVSATVYCSNDANLREVYLKVQTALQRFFRPRKGMLGFSVYKSDVYDTIMESDKSIQYVQIALPSEDLLVMRNQYVKLTTVDLTMSYASRAAQGLSIPGPTSLNLTNGSSTS